MDQASNGPWGKGVIVEHCLIFDLIQFINKRTLNETNKWVDECLFEIVLLSMSIIYYSSMEVNTWQRNRIYADPRIQTIQKRIQFISTKRKKNRFSIQTKLINNNTKNCSTMHWHQPSKYSSNPTQAQQQLQIPKMSSHSKTKSVELIDMKTKRYYECKQNSERLLKQKQLQRLEDFKAKRIKRIKVLVQQQRARENLSKYQEAKLVELKKNCMNRQVEQALILKTVEMKQTLLREQEEELRCYENELSYRSAVMRKIREMMDKGC